MNLGEVTIDRAVLEPGWGWEKCVIPIVKTDSCQAPPTQYIVSGRIKVVMDDGTEEEFGPGDAAAIPPGHNAWVIGNEPVVGIDFTGLKEYARLEIMRCNIFPIFLEMVLSIDLLKLLPFIFNNFRLALFCVDV